MHLSTFSIVACDPSEGIFGIAVASKFLAVGSVVPWAKAGIGAIATQSYANTQYGPNGLDLLASDFSAEKALDHLLSSDPQSQKRQVGIVDKNGRAVTYTGSECYSWAGGVTGSGYAIQGNILAGSNVINAMENAFLNNVESFPRRLFSALFAGDLAGGDRRGKQSAALLVVKPGGGYGGFNDRWIDLRVDDHDNPITRLGDILHLHELYFGTSEPSCRIKVKKDILILLQQIMLKLGYYSGNIDGFYSNATRTAFTAFIGNENFEDRVNFETGEIDKPVLDYILERFGKY